MMEKASDLIDNLKERLSNPFVFSFLFSWLFFNWEISISLLWYDPKQLETEYNSTIFSVIRSRLSFLNTFVYPLAFAFGYTFVLPMFRNLIHMFQAWNSKWGDRQIFGISRQATVSFEKYLKTRQKYEEQKKRLADVLREEESITNSLDLAQAEIKKLTNERDSLKRSKLELESIQSNLSNNNVLQGKWSITHNDRRFNIEIVSNNLYHLDDFDSRKQDQYVIDHVHFRDNRIFFVAFDQSPRLKAPEVYDLELQGNKTMIGKKDSLEMIRFERIR